MDKKNKWEEAVEEYFSRNKIVFEEKNSEMKTERLELNLNSISNRKPKEKYEYYNPDNFTTDAKKLYENIDKMERERERATRERDIMMKDRDYKSREELIKVSINTQNITQDWKSLDNETVKREARERNISGKNIDMAINTIKNFDVDEIENKMRVIERFNSGTETMEYFNNLKNNIGIEYVSKDIKKFLENYEILEEPEIDLETGMTALVIGNRKTKEVEIIFGASQDPSRIPKKDRPVKLENFQGSEKLKNYIEQGKNGEYALKDWSGNMVSSLVISANQKVSLEYATKIQKLYENGHKGYKTLVATNGHSKGGGSSIYTSSHLNLKSFTIDPAPVVEVGRYINNNKFLTIVPNNGNGALTTTERVVGTDYHTAKYKVGISHGKGEYKTSNILAVPVDYSRDREEFIEDKLHGFTKVINKGFLSHYSDIEDTTSRLRELQRYTEEVEPKFREVFQNGRYIDKRQEIKGFTR